MSDEEKQAHSAGNQQVQLGIGTLIISALIVSMCSGRSDTEKVRQDTAELRKQVSEINQKLDKLVEKAAPAPIEGVVAPADGVTRTPGQ